MTHAAASADAAHQPGETGHHAACRFYVQISTPSSRDSLQALFTEVSGLQIEMVTSDLEEGGMNDFVHKLPGRLKVSNVTLKHGLTKSMDFMQWCINAATKKPMDRRNVSVIMYDTMGEPVVRWDFADAFPVRWSGPQFTADSTMMAIESIELAHRGVTLQQR